MGETASALEFERLMFTAPINIKIATLISAEMGITFTVFLTCVVLDLQKGVRS